MIVGMYVDDLVITGTNRGDIGKFKKEMSIAFKMSDLGVLRYYLSIEVEQTSIGINLSQGAYALKILERVGMTWCNLRQTPMGSCLKLSKNS
jgi:hypothetical protein